MDPQPEKNPGLHLPQPSLGEGSLYHNQYEATDNKAEQAATPELQTIAPILPPSSSASTNSPVSLTQQQALADDSAAHSSAVPADENTDSELDREWVNKAKMIVERTKDDPYAQSHEIGKVKADYMRVRYNKHIKVAQDKVS